MRVLLCLFYYAESRSIGALACISGALTQPCCGCRSEPRGRRREEEEGACVSECLLLWLRRGALLLRLD